MTTPARLKAYLASVKKDVIDSDEKDIELALKALVLNEIVQRGVLPSSSYNDDISRVAGAALSAAGKQLLDDSSNFPKPLLAGSSAMAGMVAEYVASLVEANENSFEFKGLEDAERRCKDVDDNRLLYLVQLLQNKEEETHIQLLHIAEGYYLRAASFQPDSPQMWKKALDVILAARSPHGGEEPLEASYPLDNLIRIAEAKGNMKRVSDLSLRLAESWLSPKSAQNPFATLFVTPFLPSLQPSIRDAKQAIQKCDMAHFDDDGELWYKLLKLRIEIKDEEITVQEFAEEKLSAANNRGVGKNEKTLKAMAFRDIMVGSVASCDHPIDVASRHLRDTMLGRLQNHQATETLTSTMTMLNKVLWRMKERAKQIGIESLKEKTVCSQKDAEKAWLDVTNFTEPLFRELAKHTEWNGIDSERSSERLKLFLSSLDSSVMAFIEESLLVSMTARWMLCGRLETSFSTDLVAFFDSLLLYITETITNRQKENISHEKDRSVLKAVDNTEESLMIRFKFALSAATSIKNLKSDASPPKSITDDAIDSLGKAGTHSSDTGEFGSTFLAFLNIWSGLKQMPWAYCSVSQARAIVQEAASCLQKAAIDWGRKSTPYENLLLKVAEADAEGGFLFGGLLTIASKRYHFCIEKAETLSNKYQKYIIQAHCMAGISRLSLSGFQQPSDTKEEHVPSEVAEKFSRMSLVEAEKAVVDSESGRYTGIPFVTKRSKEFHKSLASQLVADSLIRSGNLDDAAAFLESAVADTPQDFEAVFALGFFRLRTVCFHTAEEDLSGWKTAQKQLLKAAKLDPSKPSPFALLGYWYERKGDATRAIGCYQKALQFDAAHPVAGRGILRLKGFYEAKSLCETATNANSPFNGWAWRAIGMHKSSIDNDNEMAAICLQEALRSTDISSPQNESMSKFYSITLAKSKELSETWIDLAICYRRLGRFSAAIKAFNSALSTVKEKLPPSAFVSWAQVELELGLVDEAAEKFQNAIEQNDTSLLHVASFGRGCALLSIAQREARDGKAGSAYSALIEAISVVKHCLSSTENASKNFLCMMKILGDMYTFGNMLPPDVFSDGTSELVPTDKLTVDLQNQISFIAEGEDYYRIAEESITMEGDENQTLRAAFACDIGANLLIQGQLISIMVGEGQGTHLNLSLSETFSNTEVRDLFRRSETAFKRSIKCDPILASAWCGLGCAISASDPLLSQHALVRAVELDKSLPDSWANLGFLYAQRDAFVAASHVMNELTQVADSPMMWICRASILERESFAESNLCMKRRKISQAADAYKASLQVVKDPDGLLGVGITSYWLAEESARQDSMNYLREFVGTTKGRSVGAALLQETVSIDDMLNKLKVESLPWKESTLKEKLQYVHQLSQIHQQYWSSSDDVKSEFTSTSKNGYVDAELVRKLCDVVENYETKTSEVVSLPNFQFELVNNPNNGILWLRIAESLAKDLVKMKGIKNRRSILEAVESATLASEKAVRLLREQFSNPKINQTKTNRMVRAQDVSQSLALSFGIAVTQRELLDSIKNPPKPANPNPYDIQRAIIMYPANRLSRKLMASNNAS